MQSARACAAAILAGVLAKRQYLDHALEQRIDPAADSRDRALTRELCYGVMRWYYRLDFILARLLARPLKSRDTDIRMLMLCGLYQLEFLRTPDHAAISDTVEAARELGKTWAVGLVNAVLRRYQREREALAATAAESDQARYAHPAWFIETLREQWPRHWEAVLEANNQRPPLHLRVNLTRCSRDSYLGELRQAGIDAEPATLVPSGIRILQPLDIHDLPGFETGLVTVQDFGAQLAAGLLELQPGQRVLDACAAPGGKTGHLAELEPALQELVAVENDARRAGLLRETCSRLGLNAKVACSDIIRRENWWDGRPFDRILLDVPCSATGVIRRHPDIKVLRKPDQVARLAGTQEAILASVWPALAAGGKLLYVTCSVLREEGEARVGEFLRRHPDAVSEEIPAVWGVPCTSGRQLLPGLDDADGFYYARLSKTG